MKKGIVRIIGIMALLGLLAAQGCAAAAVGYLGYKMSQGQTESAEKRQRSADLATYANYRVQMERVNLEREKCGLKPQPIMTQEDWIGAQTAGRPGGGQWSVVSSQ